MHWRRTAITISVTSVDMMFFTACVIGFYLFLMKSVEFGLQNFFVQKCIQNLLLFRIL